MSAPAQIDALDVALRVYPTRFTARPAVYERPHARESWLTLPFRAEDFDGIAFA